MKFDLNSNHVDYERLVSKMKCKLESNEVEELEFGPAVRKKLKKAEAEFDSKVCRIRNLTESAPSTTSESTQSKLEDLNQSSPKESEDTSEYSLFKHQSHINALIFPQIGLQEPLKHALEPLPQLSNYQVNLAGPTLNSNVFQGLFFGNLPMRTHLPISQFNLGFPLLSEMQLALLNGYF